MHDCRLERVPQIPKSVSDFSPGLSVSLSRVIMSWMDELEVMARLLVLVPRAVLGHTGLWNSEDLQLLGG